MSARIPPLPLPADTAAEISPAGELNKARPANIFGTLLHHPDLSKQFGRLGNALLAKGLIPGREREIVILRIGWDRQSVYEFGQHTLIGRAVGISDAEIAAIAGGDTSTFSEDEQTLITLADELSDNSDVSDGTWERLAARWSHAELVELLILAGFYMLVSGFLNAARVELDDGVPSWPR